MLLLYQTCCRLSWVWLTRHNTSAQTQPTRVLRITEWIQSGIIVSILCWITDKNDSAARPADSTRLSVSIKAQHPGGVGECRSGCLDKPAWCWTVLLSNRWPFASGAAEISLERNRKNAKQRWILIHFLVTCCREREQHVLGILILTLVQDDLALIIFTK